MSQLSNFKRQHREIRELVSMITSLLKHDLLCQEPTKIRYILSTLAGKLMMNLAMEDQFLYPSLKEKDDQRIQTTAHKFFTEMGDLMNVFKNYSQKWLSPSLIRENPDSFIQDSQDILHSLLKRIEQEDQQLYPLLEEAE